MGGEDGTNLSPEERLDTLRREYPRLRAKYGPQHPDVVQTRREIEMLEAQTSVAYDTEAVLEQLRFRAQGACLRPWSVIHQNIPRFAVFSSSSIDSRSDLALARSESIQNKGKVTRATNPTYIQLQAQLNANSKEREILLAQRDSFRDKLETYERRVAAMPDVERVYQGLVRDYEDTQAEIPRKPKTNSTAAELSQSLEAERMSERFSLIEAAPTSDRTDKTEAKGHSWRGFDFVDCGIGVGLVLIADFFDQGLYGARQLAFVTGEAPLVAVPRIVTSADRASVVGHGPALGLGDDNHPPAWRWRPCIST